MPPISLVTFWALFGLPFLNCLCWLLAKVLFHFDSIHTSWVIASTLPLFNYS